MRHVKGIAVHVVRVPRELGDYCPDPVVVLISVAGVTLSPVMATQACAATLDCSVDMQIGVCYRVVVCCYCTRMASVTVTVSRVCP